MSLIYFTNTVWKDTMQFCTSCTFHLLTFIYILQATRRPEGLWLITKADIAAWSSRSACSSGRAFASDLRTLRFPGLFSNTVCVVNLPILFGAAQDSLIHSELLCRCQLYLLALKAFVTFVCRAWMELCALGNSSEDSPAEEPKLTRVKVPVWHLGPEQ